jgi:hypothetical protein
MSEKIETERLNVKQADPSGTRWLEISDVNL